MKTKLLIPAVAGALLLVFGAHAAVQTMKPEPKPVDNRGHVLLSQWQAYAEAEAKDLPATQEKILEEIKAEALSKGLAWDYYEAASRRVSVGASRNWKVRDSLQKAFTEEAIAFPVPIVGVEYALGYRGADAVLALIRERAEALKTGCNRAFYQHSGRVSSLMGGALKDYISDDYSYSLWALSRKRWETAYPELKAQVAGTYPAGAYLEYEAASRTQVRKYDDPVERRAALQEVKQRYAGRGISFYAEGALLQMRKDSLDRVHAPSAEYRALYDAVLDCERRRAALSGEEKRIAMGAYHASRLADQLTETSVSVQVEEDTVRVLLQNLPGATVELYRDGTKKPLFTRKLNNSARSFYVTDTLQTLLPVLDDGEYVVSAKNGKLIDQAGFRRFTLSLAEREISTGRGVYVTDYMTGEPLSRADLILTKNGKEVASARKVTLGEGFTPLPKNIASNMTGEGSYALSATWKGPDGRLRKSQELYVGEILEAPLRHFSGERCNLYLDKGAYNPGETVHFKGVLYQGDMVDQVAPAKEGVPVRVTLFDAEGNKVSSLNLKTNAWGSVAGEFAIPTGLRNGMFSIDLSGDGWRGSRSLRVDEFVLPTFEVSFDKVEKMYIPGDTVTLSGHVTSYSGHALTSAKVSFRATYQDKVLGEGTVSPASDGSFSLQFATDPAPDWEYCNVEVTVMDETGETQGYNRGIWVGTQLNMDVQVENAVSGDFSLLDPAPEEKYWRKQYSVSTAILQESTARLTVRVYGNDGGTVPLESDWTLSAENGTLLQKGKALSGVPFEVDLSACPSGLYVFKAVASLTDRYHDREIKREYTQQIIKLLPEDSTLDAPVEYLFLSPEEEVETGGQMRVRAGTAGGPVWAVVELYGQGRSLLHASLLYLEGKRGQTGSLQDLSFEYLAEYPDAVRLQIFYFKDGSSHTYEKVFRRHRHTLDLPLDFTVFEDRTYPDTELTFSLKTLPEVECLAAVFDKSTEQIAPNHWPEVSLNQFNVPNVWISSVPGLSGNGSPSVLVGASGGLRVRGKTRMAKGARVEMVEETMLAREAPMAMNSMADSKEMADALPEEMADVAVREDFASTLTFQPFLYSDKEGRLSFSFRTSDKISTYYVAVYGHDKQMRNRALRRELTVTLPAKVALVQPQYLYAGDTYTLSATVSSIVDEPLEGTLALYCYNGKDYKQLQPVSVQSEQLRVPAHGEVPCTFRVPVRPDAGDMGLKVVFSSKDREGKTFSDAVFVPVPVWEARQQVTESHAAVLLAGMDKEALVKQLRAAFVNTSGYGAEYKEISILDMVKDAIPDKVNPASMDVLSLTEALYVRLLAAELTGKAYVPADGGLTDAQLVKKILSCHNADGGYGWFEGMQSSPILTAVVLERLAKMAAGPRPEQDLLSQFSPESAVKYLDDNYFSVERPVWCGGLSMEQYLYVRSFYPSVPFSVSGSGNPVVFQKRMKEFKKAVNEYLVPAKVRGLSGQILAKARRLGTLYNLAAEEAGTALAKAWGVTLGTRSKVLSSLGDDVRSLLEYAVPHRDGGMYYPNAVMPFRGLLENEAYAHSLLCDLLADYVRYAAPGDEAVSRAVSTADAVRIWLMLQKETQHWDEEPAFVDAIHSVLNGSDAVKATSVLVMTQTYEKPFEEIKAAGNGFTVRRRFFRLASSEEETVSVQEIQPGTVLKRGDRIRAEYEIWNAENRSFVRLTAPREAALRPVRQLSGMYGWGIRPLRVGTYFSFQPQGYRNVKPSCTEYYFDVYPEEKSTVSEEFFVTQTGTFSAPVVQIESLYAPHYRANGGFGSKVIVE